MYSAYLTLLFPINLLSYHSTIIILDNMSNPHQTRSKRPLSPSAPSSAWNTATSTARKTSRPNHNISSTVRDDIADLDEQGLRDLVNQLVNFHPPSREKIAELLPTIKRASPAIVKSTESKYFQGQVDSCRYFLSDQEWTRHPTVAKLTSCAIVEKAVEHELGIIMKSVDACEPFEPVIRYNCSKGEYFVDAAIAVLDIGLLLIERHSRLAKKGHNPERWWCTCECQVCSEVCIDDREDDDGFCNVGFCLVTFANICHVIWHSQGKQLSRHQVGVEDSESVRSEWLAAICYATPDNSPHALRNALSRYVDLPPLVTNPGPNANQTVALTQWLETQMARLLRIVVAGVEAGVMPERNSHPVPDVAALSL